MAGIEHSQLPDLEPFDIPISAWTIFSTMRYSSIAALGRIVSGTVLSIGGMVAGAYVMKHLEQPTGWAITSFSIGAAGVYIAGQSVCNLWCTPSEEGLYNLDHETAADYEETYFNANPDAARDTVVLAEFNAFSRLNSETSLLTPPIDKTSSGLPEASLSDMSSDILNLNLSNYLPRSTDLSFRPSDKDRGKRKTCVKKDWNSAPTILEAPKDDFVIAMNVEVNMEELQKEAPGPGQGQDTDVMEKIPSEESLL